MGWSNFYLICTPILTKIFAYNNKLPDYISVGTSLVAALLVSGTYFYLVSDISKGMTLEAGDIIATGTPGGVGMSFNPPKYMKSGDKIVCYIENIGELINFVE